MINIADEIISHIAPQIVSGNKLVAAKVTVYRTNSDEVLLKASLPIKHTKKMRTAFYRLLDFEYQNGANRIDGTLWFEDGSFSRRTRYVSNEWWERIVVPRIEV